MHVIKSRLINLLVSYRMDGFLHVIDGKVALWPSGLDEIAGCGGQVGWMK